MKRPAVLCPACVAFLPQGYAEWEAQRATCPRCRLVLVLDGELVPLSPAVGYPDRLFALPVERDDETPLLVEHHEETTRIRGRSWLERHLQICEISPTRVVSRGAMMRRLSTPLDLVDGVVPTQVIRWEKQSSELVPRCHWQVQLCQGNTRRWLLAMATWDESRRWSTTLNAAIAHARTQGSAYRG